MFTTAIMIINNDPIAEAAPKSPSLIDSNNSTAATLTYGLTRKIIAPVAVIAALKVFKKPSLRNGINNGASKSFRTFAAPPPKSFTA